MSFKKYYLIFLILLSGCAVNQIKTPVVPIDSAIIYRPMCFLEYIERGDYGTLNDSISKANERLIMQKLMVQDFLPINGTLKTNNFRQQGAVDDEVDQLFYQLQQGADVHSIPIPPTIDHLMEEQNQQFLVLIHQTGFFRKKGNYGKQLLLAFGIALVSNGNVSYVPTKAISTMDFVVLDAQSNSIVIRNITSFGDLNPNDSQTIDKHFHKIFKHLSAVE